jgi:hypothetical protein
MKTKTLILLLTIISLKGFSTKPNLYHLVAGEVYKHHYHRDYDSLKIVFAELKSFTTVFPTDLEKFTEVSITLNDTAMALHFFRELLTKTNTDTSVLRKNIGIEPIKTYPQFKEIEQNYATIKLEYYRNFDFDVSAKILGMYANDRFVRLNIPEMEQRGNIMETLDKENFSQVREIIEKQGFPTISTIGQEAFNGLYIMLMHASTLSFENFQYVDSLLQQQMLVFKIELWRYANIIDRYKHFNNEPQIYGNFSVHDSTGKRTSGTILNPENLDIRRYEIGMGSFLDWSKALKIQALPNDYKHVNRWDYYLENK